MQILIHSFHRRENYVSEKLGKWKSTALVITSGPQTKYISHISVVRNTFEALSQLSKKANSSSQTDECVPSLRKLLTGYNFILKIELIVCEQLQKGCGDAI